MLNSMSPGAFKMLMLVPSIKDAEELPPDREVSIFPGVTGKSSSSK